MKLRKLYPQANWKSERQLFQDKFLDSNSKRYDHVADGVLVFPDDRNIAIEVELSMKAKERLNEILSWYITRFSIEEVWYYCSPSILHKIKKAAERGFNIKVFSLDEVLC